MEQDVKSLHDGTGRHLQEGGAEGMARRSLDGEDEADHGHVMLS